MARGQGYFYPTIAFLFLRLAIRNHLALELWMHMDLCGIVPCKPRRIGTRERIALTAAIAVPVPPIEDGVAGEETPRRRVVIPVPHEGDALIRGGNSGYGRRLVPKLPGVTKRTFPGSRRRSHVAKRIVLPRCRHILRSPRLGKAVLQPRVQVGRRRPTTLGNARRIGRPRIHQDRVGHIRPIAKEAIRRVPHRHRRPCDHLSHVTSAKTKARHNWVQSSAMASKQRGAHLPNRAPGFLSGNQVAKASPPNTPRARRPRDRGRGRPRHDAPAPFNSRLAAPQRVPQRPSNSLTFPQCSTSWPKHEGRSDTGPHRVGWTRERAPVKGEWAANAPSPSLRDRGTCAGVWRSRRRGRRSAQGRGRSRWCGRGLG